MRAPGGGPRRLAGRLAGRWRGGVAAARVGAGAAGAVTGRESRVRPGRTVPPAQSEFLSEDVEMIVKTVRRGREAGGWGGVWVCCLRADSRKRITRGPR